MFKRITKKIAPLLILPILTIASASPEQESYQTIPVDDIWAANTVNFALKTVGDQQFIAYYDSDRMMTVASRSLDSHEWTKKTLDSRLEFDSHNYVAMGIDKLGYIHVSGNMHNVPLIYYRSAKPYDVTSLERVPSMVGTEEYQVTYPKFFYNQAGDLLYSYRIGSSGDGNILINRFLTESKTWERYLDTPLFVGREEDGSTRNAYHHNIYDSQGRLHFGWIWRWTPAVETSHIISYAMTPDLINWYDAGGTPIQAPFRPDATETHVDPVPTKGGTHNGRVKVITDKNDQPIVGYVKYDADGNTQFYLSRFIDGKWQPKQISDWDFRWKFHGGGDGMTVGGHFNILGISDENLIVVDWKTEKGDSGQWVLDAQTLEHSDTPHTLPPPLPAAARERQTEHPNFQVNFAHDTGTPADGKRYALRWESGRRQHAWRKSGPQPKGPITKLVLLKY